MITLLSCACLLAAALFVGWKLQKLTKAVETHSDRVYFQEQALNGMQRAANKVELAVERLDANFTLPHPSSLPDLSPITEPAKTKHRKRRDK